MKTNMRDGPANRNPVNQTDDASNSVERNADCISLGDEAFFKAIVNNFHEELMVISPDFRIIFANRLLLNRLGKQESDVIGEHCYRMSHGRETRCELPTHECPVKMVMRTGKTSMVTHRHRIDSCDKKETYVGITASPIRNDGGRIIAIAETMRDITSSRNLEMKTAETYRNLLALSTIATVVSQSLNLTTVLTSALDKLLEIMRTDIGGILLLDEEKQMLCYQAHRGFSSGYVDKVCYPLDEDVNGKVFQAGEMVMIEDVAGDTRVANSALISAEGIRSFISAPLIAKGKKLGIVNVASREPRKFSPEDIQFLLSALPQIALAVENAKLHREVELKEQMRGELLKEIFTIQEEERRRIARELHDETSQALAGLAANLGAIWLTPVSDTAGIMLGVKKAQALSISILEEIHKLIYDLRPTVLDDLGLVAATRWLADNLLGATGISVSFRTRGRVRRLPSSSEASLYRVIQEAVTNIVRHSAAKNAAIKMNFTKDVIGVTISDDGTGFDVDEALSSRERPRGLGLLGMKERIEFMGGRLVIKSHIDGKGTVVEVEIPLICRVPVNPGN